MNKIKLPSLSGLFAQAGGNVAEKVMNALDGLITNKEELKEKENELRKIISEETIKTLEYQYKDIDSARNREIEISKSQHSTKLQKNALPIIGIGVLLLSFGLFITFTFTNYITIEKREIVAQMIGTLNGFCFMVLGYYFSASNKYANNIKTN